MTDIDFMIKQAKEWPYNSEGTPAISSALIADEVERLREELGWSQAKTQTMQNYAATVEAERDRYREALQKVADMDGESFPIAFAKCIDVAREALEVQP